VVDNASTDDTADLQKIYARDITIVRNREDRGWAGGINQGFDLGSNPNVVFLSDAIEVLPGWLGSMVSFLNSHPRIGAVGPLSSNDEDWQCIDRMREKLVPQIPQFMTDNMQERNRILKYHFQNAGILIDGMLGLFCVALKRRTVSEIGLLNENGNGNCSDEYCRRLRKSGYVLGISLDSYIVRH
jgi:GT2 family glycosyltransferase